MLRGAGEYMWFVYSRWVGIISKNIVDKAVDCV